MPLIQKGKHLVTAQSAKLGETDKGTPYVAIHFADSAGNAITGFLYLTEKSEERTIKTLCEVFGFDCNFDTLAGQIAGKEASIEVEEETYNGKPSLKVKWINKPRTAAPVSGGFAAQLSARAKAYALKNGLLGKGTSPRPAPKPAAAPAPAPDDDVPF